MGRVDFRNNVTFTASTIGLRADGDITAKVVHSSRHRRLRSASEFYLRARMSHEFEDFDTTLRDLDCSGEVLPMRHLFCAGDPG